MPLKKHNVVVAEQQQPLLAQVVFAGHFNPSICRQGEYRTTCNLIWGGKNWQRNRIALKCESKGFLVPVDLFSGEMHLLTISIILTDRLQVVFLDSSVHLLFSIFVSAMTSTLKFPSWFLMQKSVTLISFLVTPFLPGHYMTATNGIWGREWE